MSVLLPALEQSHPLVRSISCWSLSRFARWLVEADSAAQMGAVLSGLLGRVLDRNKRVQEAACSAVATLTEEAGEAVLPWAAPMLQCLGLAVRQYQARNLRLAYDALSTLASAIGAELASPQLLPLLLPPLLERWRALGDDDRDLPPLLECMTAVCRNLGPAFATYAPAVVDRCLGILTAQAAAARAGGDGGEGSGRGPAGEAAGHDKELVICSLDLLGGLTEGLGASAQPLLGAPAVSARLLPLVEDAAMHPAPDVRQSALALVGDLAGHASAVLLPRLPQLLALCTRNLAPDMLSPESVSACNNAAWAAGELALTADAELLAAAVLPLAERLVVILGPAAQGQSAGLNNSLVENAAISLGRVGGRCPALLAPHLPLFLADWCLALRRIRDELEKEQAFSGLCEVLFSSGPLLHAGSPPKSPSPPPPVENKQRAPSSSLIAAGPRAPRRRAGARCFPAAVPSHRLVARDRQRGAARAAGPAAARHPRAPRPRRVGAGLRGARGARAIKARAAVRPVICMDLPQGG